MRTTRAEKGWFPAELMQNDKFCSGWALSGETYPRIGGWAAGLFISFQGFGCDTQRSMHCKIFFKPTCIPAAFGTGKGISYCTVFHYHYAIGDLQRHVQVLLD